MKCAVCDETMEVGGLATQVYRRDQAVVTVTGIPAVAVCPHCQNAVLEWSVAQQVEDLVGPLLRWHDSHSLPQPIITVVFPMGQVAA